jgi:hypothetical protein
MVSFSVKVPVYLGYDDRNNIHHFHGSETQEVELWGWYFPSQETVELTYGVNLYTRFDMSEDWIRALDTHADWSYRLAKVAKEAYATK